jgi:hypothetical protein
MSEFKIAIEKEFKKLFEEKWQFSHNKWPSMDPEKYHRTEIKDVNEINMVKNFVLERLGFTTVFFFLSVLFSTQHYVGPYRNVEKGLLILYHMLTGVSIAEMGRFIPRSSFYALYKDFWISNYEFLNSTIDNALLEMFSTERIRVLCAKEFNPSGFKHVTLMLDGHDTRASYINSSVGSKDFFSYKLKKSGFRTQVCMDINGMVTFVSASAPCALNNDGSMLSNINLTKVVKTIDCLALDGGYTLYLSNIINFNPHLTLDNFEFPIRKQHGKHLDQTELTFNETFGSFRSKIESLFGDLGTIFNRFNNKTVIRVSELNIFTIQLKCAFLMLNMKRTIIAANILNKQHHSLWIQQHFDYPSTSDKSLRLDYKDITDGGSSLQDKLRRADDLNELQKQFLLLDIANYSDIFTSDNNDVSMVLATKEDSKDSYEIERVIAHRKKRGQLEYQVKWKDYPESENSWLSRDKFDNFECIDEYHNRMHN